MMALFVIVLALAVQDSAPRRGVESVPAVDLRRYAGLWYEVARFPNRFQARCRGETTATYEPLPNGELRVVNSCRDAEHRLVRAEGRVRLADRRGPASRLKVRFAPKILSFLPMVWGDYWILDLTDDYGAALVGTPSREYLWVLSRTPQLDGTTYQRLVATAAAQGFDVARLVRSPAARGGVSSPLVPWDDCRSARQQRNTLRWTSPCALVTQSEPSREHSNRADR